MSAELTPIPEEHAAQLEPLLARAVSDGLNAEASLRWIKMLSGLPVMAHSKCVAAVHPGGLVSIGVPELQPWHLGGFSGTRPVANGAAITGLMDGAFGGAANLHALARGGDGAATVDLSVQMMRPTLGPSMMIYAAAVNVGRQLVFTEAVLIDGTGAITAKGSATCMVPQAK